jgi:hypothetical protein
LQSIVIEAAAVIVWKCHENARNIENENKLAKVMIQYERTADLDYHNNKLFTHFFFLHGIKPDTPRVATVRERVKTE